VALFVLTVGLLALAGVAAGVTRLTTRAALNTQLAALLSERLEILTTEVCRSAGGEESRGAFRVRWTVTPADAGRRVTVRASAPGQHSPLQASVSRFVACRP